MRADFEPGPGIWNLQKAVGARTFAKTATTLLYTQTEAAPPCLVLTRSIADNTFKK